MKKNSLAITVYKDKRGEWRWRAKHTNKKILADSAESYKRKHDAEMAALRFVAIVKRHTFTELLPKDCPSGKGLPRGGA